MKESNLIFSLENNSENIKELKKLNFVWGEYFASLRYSSNYRYIAADLKNMMVSYTNIVIVMMI